MDVDAPHLPTVSEQPLQARLRRRNRWVTAPRGEGRGIDPRGRRTFGYLVSVQYSYSVVSILNIWYHECDCITVIKIQIFGILKTSTNLGNTTNDMQVT